ncbi:hypothetical protein P7C73_g6157, partial [Tremellales sp. Uapishka_1]
MAKLPLVRLPANATIHRFGTPNPSPASSALLRFGKEGWTIRRDTSKEGWAIVGDAEGRKLAVDTLLSRHRIQPAQPPPGPFPYLTTLSNRDSRPIRHLAFARPPPSGDFTDFTARYGSLQEEDKQTFREALSNLDPSPSKQEIDHVAHTMRISHLLDMPFVSFSSGQTRRARIASALLTRPVLLVLEDPMAGLDVASRTEVGRTLGDLNRNGEIRVVLVLRGKGGDMPDWVENICEVRKGEVWIGSREEWESTSRPLGSGKRIEAIDVERDSRTKVDQEPVVRLSDVSVSYGEGTRKVLQDVSWTIRPGEKWHLQGANGRSFELVSVASLLALVKPSADILTSFPYLFCFSLFGLSLLRPPPLSSPSESH